MFVLAQFGSVTRRLGEVATIEIPRRARLDPPGATAREHATWVGYRLDRFHTWAMGSGTPYRAVLFINLHAPGAGDASYAEALRDNARDLNGGADDWKLLEKGDRWEIGQGRYTVNMLNEPTWRLQYRDPSRRVSVLWQVYQKDVKLADARAALVRMVESVQRVTEPRFAEIADRPRRQAEENERKVRAAREWLAARGFTPLEAGVPVTVDGITVEYMAKPERRLMLYKGIAARPTGALPRWAGYGVRTWADTGWENTMPDGDYYPMPGTRAMLDRSQSRPGPHHFLIRTIRLDELAEADYHIADFFELARGSR